MMWSILGWCWMILSTTARAWIPRSGVTSRRCLLHAASTMLLEVEAKFVVEPGVDLADALTQLGFVRPDNNASSNMMMVDWYFDTPSLTLLQQDWWLRHRSHGQSGVWELKCRTEATTSKTAGTVYQELSGEEALASVREVLAAATGGDQLLPEKDSVFAPYEAPPTLPNDLSCLRPLARIGTAREHWTFTAEDYLSIDLDTTDFGYTVGEVECLVADATQVADAQARIHAILDDLPLNHSKQPPMGKLEYFLSHYRPKIYQQGVEWGIIASRHAE